MPDLEQLIADWRRQMSRDGITSADVLNELESHLREDIARQIESGVALAAAFEAAVQRIGSAAELQQELAKAGATPRHWWQVNLIASPALERKIGGILIFAMGCFVSIGMSICILFRWGSCADMNPAQQALALGATLLIGLAIGCGKFLHPILPSLANKRTRALLIMGGILLVMSEFSILFYGIFPRAAYTVPQLLVMLLWAMVPWAVMTGVVVGIDEATRRKTISA